MASGGINQVLNTAKSSLATNQLSLATTAHNVSNVNTEGYSRQRVDVISKDPSPSGHNAQVGTGVTVSGITRSHSDFLARRIETEQSSLGRFESASDINMQLENIFKDDGATGLSASVSKFFNDIRSLSAQPESTPLKSAVKESAAAVTGRFRAASDSISQVRSDVDNRIVGAIENVNAITTRIASLNTRIMELSARGISPNDELDSRDLAVQDLAKYVPVRITPVENNGINVLSGRVGVLVNAGESFKLMTGRGASETSTAGAVHVYVAPEAGSSVVRDVSEFINDGSIGGLLRVRDQFIPKIVEKVDNLAFELANQVNNVHKSGFTRNGRTGVPFFAEPNSKMGAAERLSLSDEVLSNVNNISTGPSPNSAGDNRVLLRMADLQDAKVFEGGTSTFTDYNASIIGNLGVEAKSVRDNLDNQNDMMGQLSTLREQLSGVSLDEEGVDMLKFQKAFDASAKMIQVADSMLDTILSLKRF